MPNFTYWYAKDLTDGVQFSVRAKTRGEVVAELTRRGFKRMRSLDGAGAFYKDAHGTTCADPKQNVVPYNALMDLVDKCLGDKHGGEL